LPERAQEPRRIRQGRTVGPPVVAPHLLEIETRTECAARAGEDHDADLGLRTQGDELGFQRAAQLEREGVHLIRTVERERCDAVSSVDQQHGFRHGGDLTQWHSRRSL
jgi:hypothetical protein